MNVLWDFRLYSYEYAHRGVGTYTTCFSTALYEYFLKQNLPVDIYVWADISKLPEAMRRWNVTWIPYTYQSWKKDLWYIPYLITKYKIDCYHYWIVLGPNHRIGVGLFHPCSVIALFYDLSVELWKKCLYARSKKTSWFWNVQKGLIQKRHISICTISQSSAADFKQVFSVPKKAIKVCYPPSTIALKTRLSEVAYNRELKFLFLAGDVHKNMAQVIRAYLGVCKVNPSIKLYILGSFAPEQLSDFNQSHLSSIIFESMDFYRQHLSTASGLLFCSLYEGLGIPPIEAMAYGCPLIVSDIASLREICDSYAYYIDPYDVTSIVDAMVHVLDNREYWVGQSLQAFTHYREISTDSIETMATLYPVS